MLSQPPPVHPNLPDEMLEPPTSPQSHPQNSSQANASKPHEHTLPNGVRLRLVLGMVINDVFARRPPSPPSRHPTRSHNVPLPPSTLRPVLGPLTAISLPPLLPTCCKPIPNDHIISFYSGGIGSGSLHTSLPRRSSGWI